MVMFGFAWTLPTGFASLAAGYITNNLGSQWIWYMCGLVSIAAIAGYLVLHVHSYARQQTGVQADKTIKEILTTPIPESARKG
jgi:hypothetical protein